MTHKIGDKIERNGVFYIVVTVDPILTPYKRPDQTTTTIGYTLGLKVTSAWELT